MKTRRSARFLMIILAVWVLGGLFWQFVTIFTVWSERRSQGDDLSRGETVGEKKIILIWNDEPMGDYAIENDVFASCAGVANQCVITNDHNLFTESNVVIFNANRLGKTKVREEFGIPPYHPPHQRWIFSTRESPCNMIGHIDNTWGGLENHFNLTMSHLLNSDIPFQYGKIVRRERPLGNKDYVAIAKRKPKLAVWVVSNCDTQSRREDYVKELQKHMHIDIIGACGNDLCAKENNEYCGNAINKEYKFYLAFENSFSTDYVTEKFFKTVEWDLVAVTRGGADYSRVGIKPAWHLDSHKFKSPKELAEYLLWLDKNPEKYAKLLEWKKAYTLHKNQEWCSLCENVHKFSTAPVKTYSKERLRDLFYSIGCQIPTDLPYYSPWLPNNQHVFPAWPVPKREYKLRQRWWGGSL